MSTDRVETDCSNCGGKHTSIRQVLVCYHGEEAGNAAADRAADRLQRELDNGLAGKMANSIAGILALKKLIDDAPPQERPALIAHAKQELEKRVGRR